jgi:hypothetical protein
MKWFMNLIKVIRFGKKDDFLTRVLRRYESKAPVSDFARELVSSETEKSINERFAKAKRKALRR